MIPTRARREDSLRRSSVRHVRLRAAVTALALVATLLGATTIAVAETPASRPTSPDPSFIPVAVRLPESASATPTPDPGAPIADFMTRRQDVVGEPTRPSPETPEAKVRAVSKVPPGRIRARGTATWYCVPGVSACHRDYSGGMYAAAGSELRVGDWRGRQVTVCRGDDCIRVTLIDWCACKGDRVIDLYGDAFRRLGSLSGGIIPVTVRW
jgi:hypothetical protein